MNHLVYAGLLLVTLAYPLMKSFEHRIQMYKKWKFMFPAIFATAAIFIAWDHVFVIQNVWWFNPEYTIGWEFLNLPVEEWLFFIVIPYACFFIYEVVKYFFKNLQTSRKVVLLHVLFSAVLMGTSMLFQDKLYTLVCCSSTGIFLLLLLFLGSFRKLLLYFYSAWALSLVPFFIVNGVLTALPVVEYNPGAITGFRLVTIPVEDAIYLLLLLFINFVIYETLKQFFLTTRQSR